MTTEDISTIPPYYYSSGFSSSSTWIASSLNSIIEGRQVSRTESHLLEVLYHTRLTANQIEDEIREMREERGAVLAELEEVNKELAKLEWK